MDNGYRKIWDEMTTAQRKEYVDALSIAFPDISPSTQFNWLRTDAPTTPKIEVCEWVSSYFKKKPELIFPFYNLKVMQMNRRIERGQKQWEERRNKRKQYYENHKRTQNRIKELELKVMELQGVRLTESTATNT